jgi:hypothetical protein
VGDDRGDGLVPVKRPWELIPLLRRLGLRSEINGGLLRAHIKRLRDAFEAARLDRGLIETVGEGYRLRAAIDRQLEERDGTA